MSRSPSELRGQPRPVAAVRRSACARGILRDILGRYLDSEPRELQFRYGPHGKPALCGAVGAPVAFNVSHSHDLALFAFSGGRDLGVDIEAIRPMPDGEDIASRFFSAREVACLRSLPAAIRNAAFFTCWTRKEAYLKALGDGLARPLDGFDVTFGPGEAARLTVAGDAGESARWSVAPLPAPAGYAAAVVAEGRVDHVRCWSWIEPATRRVTAVLDEVKEAV